MKAQKRQFSAEFKVKVLREHLENQVPVGKICEQYGITPKLVLPLEERVIQRSNRYILKKEDKQNRGRENEQTGDEAEG